jgi:pimeloyl-ACP methyl ester carboxylesterase
MYGDGEPMIIIHDNGGDIKAMQKQIPFFDTHFKVIVADSREHGRSGRNTLPLSYEQMASDWTVLLDSLRIDSAYVFGWGNGGIIGLLMAINSPAKVRKLAVLSANVRADSTALQEWFLQWIKSMNDFTDKKLLAKDATQNWNFLQRLLNLMRNQPHIPFENIRKIKVPTLVMCGDRDIVRNEHTAKFFQYLPNAHLCIFPGATHMLPWEDPDLLNRTIDNFFRQPFTTPDTKDYY